MQAVIIGMNQAGQRLDKFLHKYLPNAPSSFLYKMMRKKNIVLNGKKALGPEILVLGDEVQFFLSEETINKFSGRFLEPAASSDTIKQVKSCVLSDCSSLEQSSDYRKAYETFHDVEILYEDSDVLIVNKSAGILTQKAQAQDISLNEWLIGYLLHQGTITYSELRTFKPSVCNRLDRNTSGIVLCGISLPGSQELSRLLKERRIQKIYRTIVLGKIDQPMVIQGYLSKNKSTNKVKIIQKADRLEREADYICTSYRPIAFSNGLTYLEVELITGKTHQIRAHLASIGHPLAGDYKYGDRNKNEMFLKYGVKAQLLHSYQVIFPELSSSLKHLSRKSIMAPLPPNWGPIIEQEQLG